MYGFSEGGGEVQEWQPRIYQAAERTTSNDTFGLFKTDGDWCWVHAQIGMTAAGSGANTIFIMNPPLPVLPKLNLSTTGIWRATALGSFVYFRPGTTFYSGVAIASSTNSELLRGVPSISFHIGGLTNDYLGSNPNFAIAANDSLSINLSYPYPHADRAVVLG